MTLKRLQGVVVRRGDQVVLGPLHFGAKTVIETQPGAVRLRLCFRAEATHALANPLIDLGVDVRVKRLDRQIANVVQEEFLGRIEHEQTLASLTGATGTAESVDVLLSRGWDADLDDKGDIREIHASRGDVGRHHHGCLALAELVGRLGADALRFTTVNFKDRLADRLEHLRRELRGTSRREEDHDFVVWFLHLVFLDDLRHEGQVVVERSDDHRLLHLKVGCRCVVADAVNVLVTRSQRVCGDLMHRLWHCGGEQKRLPLRR